MGEGEREREGVGVEGIGDREEGRRGAGRRVLQIFLQLYLTSVYLFRMVRFDSE